MTDHDQQSKRCFAASCIVNWLSRDRNWLREWHKTATRRRKADLSVLVQDAIDDNPPEPDFDLLASILEDARDAANWKQVAEDATDLAREVVAHERFYASRPARKKTLD